MLGAITWEELEEMTIPDLVSRLESVRRVDARRRLDALQERMTTARGSAENVAGIVQSLGEAAGLQTLGDIEDFAAALKGL